ncbi:MAG: DNA polymerase III subunit gamma/tau [Elusimicrobia bacterium]|nr:DNA polymerase III subunit gamma/tau [Elusimicrobiota bacterium]
MSKPAYIVLARKYRPQDFEELLGQPAVAVTLKNAIASKKIAHAYLFTGPRGVGKTTMARILAKALNCVKGPAPAPCGECEPCSEVASSSCLDVLEMDAASHTGVDNVRQVIIDTVGLAPARDRYKVFIIDEAHMLSSAAFNALLKTLEEPPPHVVFILATTESTKIPSTIASRCQRFKFRPVPVELLREHLESLAKKEKIEIELEALELLARTAEGSLRDAVSLLDQCRSFSEKKVTAEAVREMFGFVPQEMLLGAAKALLGKDAKGLAQWLQRVYEEGVEPSQFLKDMRAALEALYLSKLGLAAAVPAAWTQAAATVSAESLGFLLRRLNRALEELRWGDSPRLSLELSLFSCLEAAWDLSDWAQRLERLEGRLSSGAACAPGEEPELAGEEPAKASAPAAGGDAWTQVLAAARKEKPALAGVLDKARVDVSAGGPWKLIIGKPFELEQAKRGQGWIEAKLATIRGLPTRVAVELGQIGHTPAAAPAAEAAAPEPEGGEGSAWKDVTESAPRASPEALKKAQQILGGKVRIVKKPQ